MLLARHLTIFYTVFYLGFSLVSGAPQHKDWLCPRAEDIAPCKCWHFDGIEIECKDVVNIEEIKRIFSVRFPDNNLKSINLGVRDTNVWWHSDPVKIPRNIFGDKIAKEIVLRIKLSEIHPEAFDFTAEAVELLSITNGPDFTSKNPIEDIPLSLLSKFTNLKSLVLFRTMLNDGFFTNSHLAFSELEFPSLGKFRSKY